MPKTLVAVCSLVVAGLQAWDSGVLEAENLLITGGETSLAGVVLPAVAVQTTRDVRVRGLAVLAAAGLMIAARVLSAHHLPELALAAFFPCTLVLLDHIGTLGGRKATPQGQQGQQD